MAFNPSVPLDEFGALHACGGSGCGFRGQVQDSGYGVQGLLFSVFFSQSIQDMGNRVC